MAAIIFDFDGTIADSFEYVLDYLARSIQGVPPQKEHWSEYRGLAMHQMARKLGAPYWRLPLLFLHGRQAMGPAMTTVAPVPGMVEALQELHQQHYKLYVVSNNTRRNVQLFLERFGIADLFEVVQGNAIFGGKRFTLRRLMRRYKIQANHAWYVGDQAADVRAAHGAGLQAVAVTWGYNNLEHLRQAHPEGMIFTPEELMSLITKHARR